MNTGYLIRLVFVLAATWSFHAKAANDVATLENLPKGDQLEVSFNSSGCFHHRTYNLTFHRATETTVSISDVRRRKELGQLPLSKSDVDGFDRLVRFYKSIVAPGNCTTGDSITISQRHEGKIIATEKYSDDTCSTYNMKDVTRILDLVRRLQKPK
jgi:hypothetical protein